MSRSSQVVRSPHGQRYLNVGCGAHFSSEWTNVDMRSSKHVIGHDLRKPLPFTDATFDAAYGSHVLEHLDPDDARRLVLELHRVLKPRGVLRLAVPDLEGICREYLRRLDEALEDPQPGALERYHWIVLELIDQMVRDRPGGRMLETLQGGAFDPRYLRERCGDEFAGFVDRPPLQSHGSPAEGWTVALARLPARTVEKLRAVLSGRSTPRQTGEAHRWMYDRLSIRLLLESAGFDEVAPTTFDQSAIPHWDRYQLDRNAAGTDARKPDSLFVEARSGLRGAT